MEDKEAKEERNTEVNEKKTIIFGPIKKNVRHQLGREPMPIAQES